MKVAILAAFAAIVHGALGAAPAAAQAYPAKPVRLIVQGPPAGGADVIVRPIAQQISGSMGQPMVVENRPGAGGVVASVAVAAAPPDGYTLLLATASGFSIAPFTLKKRPYDPVSDFAPVTLLATAPMMATVHPSLPVRTVKELVALARARPRELFYASNGTGSFSHLTTELFCRTAGITMTHVPHKGGTPAVLDTVSGNVQVLITALPTLLTQVKAGRLRAIAVTGARRSSAVPEVPTVAESALAGFESVQWYGIFAPRNTPAAIAERLHAEFRKAGANPAVKAPLAIEGADLVTSAPQELAEFLRRDVEKWQRVIREANLVLD
ncbi:MAG TPA: tripartite tricarboxylate transporter substrate-binding protein [Burkholderiales bacterium]|nr:tripartite tricarboxylate transporter substrate-binding protein [Burkholderiales bacterium]